MNPRGWLCRHGLHRWRWAGLARTGQWMQENGVGILGWPNGEKLYVCQRCGREALR